MTCADESWRDPSEHEMSALLLQEMLVEVVSRLPEDVRQWLTRESRQMFFGDDGDGDTFTLDYPVAAKADSQVPLGAEDGSDSTIYTPAFHVCRVPGRLARVDREKALFEIARIIAASRLGHFGLDWEPGPDEDRLTTEWGFVKPTD